MIIIIDASNMILGRLASFAAKELLLGKEVRVINCEKAVISGTKDKVFAEYLHRMERGTIRKGPFLHRMPDKIVRRTIRGMLPWKKAKGKMLFRKVYCYVGMPEELKDKKPISVEGAEISKLPTLKFVSLDTLCRRLGAKL
jgi:large subunit ribosomal protein L13